MKPCSLYVSRSGTGPSLLLLHGIGGSRVAWDRLVSLIESEFTCIVPDLPGYGDSPDPSGPGLDTIVDSIAALPLGGPVHVVGVSFGGLCALALARHHPHLVRSLVLVGATIGRAIGSPEQREQWLKMRRDLAPRLADNSAERALEIAAPGADAGAIEEISRAMRRVRPIGYTAVAEAIASTDARPWLAQIEQPALVLCGDHDAVTGLAVSQILAAKLPDATFEVVARSGHAPHIEQPDQVADAMRRFFAERMQSDDDGSSCDE